YARARAANRGAGARRAAGRGDARPAGLGRAGRSLRQSRPRGRPMSLDPIQQAVFRHRLEAIAEEMGETLGRTATSPNIKERRDFSCALFGPAGELVAQAAHIPVHLGSMPMSVAAAIAAQPLEEGDVVVLNDPFAGGTHLPDMTMIAPVF